MARLCKSRASKGGDDHYHIFINSVEGISRIIRLAGLTPDQVRIVCSQSKDSKDKNQEKLGEFRIQTTLDPVRLFNFYTSTCFEGQDIFDKVGRTFIVSDRYLDHTKIDIMTTLAQVCGRLRDSEFKNEIHQYYATSPYKDVSLEEFKAATECQFNEAKVFAAAMDSAAKGTLRDRLIEDFVKKYMFLAEQNGKIVADRNLVNKELMNFGIVNGQYASQFNMNASLSQAGFQVNTNNHTHLEDVELETITSIEKSSFKDIFEEYAGIRSSKGMFNMRIFRASRIELEKPLVKEAFEILGADRVREMKYHQSNIKKEIIKRKHETADTKIFLLLDGQLPKQVAIPKSEIKQKLTDIYKELGLKQTAKATDLER